MLHLLFGAFISSFSQSTGGTIYSQSIQANAPFQWRDQQSQMGFIRKCQGFGQNWAYEETGFYFCIIFEH